MANTKKRKMRKNPKNTNITPIPEHESNAGNTNYDIVPDEQPNDSGQYTQDSSDESIDTTQYNISGADPLSVLKTDVPKPPTQPAQSSQTRPQSIDLRQFIITGEENKAQMPKVEERQRPATVITQPEYNKTEEVPEKWQKTSSVKLPGGIEIAHVVFESKIYGKRQVIIAINDGKVAAINTLRLGD